MIINTPFHNQTFEDHFGDFKTTNQTECLEEDPNPTIGVRLSIAQRAINRVDKRNLRNGPMRRREYRPRDKQSQTNRKIVKEMNSW